MVMVAVDAMQRAMEEKLLAMRPRFLAQISQRLDQMEELRDIFAEAPGPGPEAEGLCQAAHKLAGVAGMFGAEELGELARFAEDALMMLAQGDSRVSPEEALMLVDDVLGEMALILEE